MALIAFVDKVSGTSSLVLFVPSWVFNAINYDILLDWLWEVEMVKTIPFTRVPVNVMEGRGLTHKPLLCVWGHYQF